MITILFLFVAFWCWFGRGPYLLRWPALLGVVVLTSGHPLAAMLGEDLAPLAGPLLTLLFAILGLTIIFRALSGSSSRGYRYHDDSTGYWHGHHNRHGHRYGRRSHWNDW